jgi:hypothetical protein
VSERRFNTRENIAFLLVMWCANWLRAFLRGVQKDSAVGGWD